MLISACKTYTSSRRCARTKIPQWVCQTASAWLEWVKLMKSVMGYQRGELDICVGEPHLFMGRRTWSIHTHMHTHTSQSARPKNCRWGSNAPPMPEQQVDRHFFMMSALSMCTFQGEQHEMTEFPARQKDRLGNFGWMKCSCLRWSSAPFRSFV